MFILSERRKASGPAWLRFRRILYFAAPWGPSTPELFAYWTVLVAGILWIIERIAFFTLIRDKGAVYTIQAVYVSTPAAVPSPYSSMAAGPISGFGFPLEF